MLQLPRRLQSIDVFRAVTMFFMIFVNDVDGVTKIPEWIKHVDEHTDGLGFADTIFPAFLFIVGLSIPFALSKRMQSNESRSTIALHIILRAFALIVMGFFHVNLENYSDTAILPHAVFGILVTLAFFLIWLDYKPGFYKTKQYIFQAAGVLILIVLSIFYRGEAHNNVIWLRPHWWGILGLIGWGYLTCALIYLFSKGRLKILIPALIFFLAYTTINQTHILDPVSGILKYFWLLNGGSEVSFIMSGIIISLIYKQSLNNNKRNFFIVMFFAAVIMFAFGFITRPFGGISKIHGTPSWVGICSGIGILVFALLMFIVDVKGKADWFNIIRPAGTSTLTCYLIPYFLYSFMGLLKIDYPVFLSESLGGILRSFAVAFVVIFIAGFLEKRHLRLKI
jgi:heparan-alpha-glucosaminide N-acetyltransferase